MFTEGGTNAVGTARSPTPRTVAIAGGPWQAAARGGKERKGAEKERNGHRQGQGKEGQE